jgi:hypothetical protein
VEAQHVIATQALVDSLEEQALLEQLLETAKPPLPANTAHLHYLLATPFRYPPAARGSRFRAQHQPGVFYAAEEQHTACAELGYWRWRFLLDSPALTSLEDRPQTVFSVAISTRTTIDLRDSPFNTDRKIWTDPDDYSGCQSLADTARTAEIDAIRYASVRDPAHGGCIALLTPTGFAEDTPRELQTWSLSVTHSRAIWQRQSALKSQALEFVFG